MRGRRAAVGGAARGLRQQHPRGAGGRRQRAGGGRAEDCLLCSAAATRFSTLALQHACLQKFLTNQDLERLVDTNDEWITTRTGIKKRHILGEGEAMAPHCARAAKAALEMAGEGPAAGSGPFLQLGCTGQETLQRGLGRLDGLQRRSLVSRCTEQG